MPAGDEDSWAINAEFWVKIIRERLDRFRTELTDEVVLDALGPCEGLRVLDAGCGEGYLARELARRGAKVTGLDTSSALINAGRGEAERLGLTVEHYVASIESIPGRDHTFDAVVCNHVMTGVNDPAAALKEIGRVTKPRGRIVILMLHPCFYTGNTAGRGGRDLTPDVYFGVRSMAQPFNVAGIKSARRSAEHIVATRALHQRPTRRRLRTDRTVRTTSERRTATRPVVERELHQAAVPAAAGRTSVTPPSPRYQQKVR
jgi:2-polyprenyl-3-methyl-5-hydroxy-6-metoxy-1,4-benzoquinol methylase